MSDFCGNENILQSVDDKLKLVVHRTDSCIVNLVSACFHNQHEKELFFTSRSRSRNDALVTAKAWVEGT